MKSLYPDHIFKAYDIRGLVAGELDEQLAYKLGQAFVQYIQEQKKDLKEKKLVVGRDMRPTSVGFEQALIQGITDAGVDVVSIGLTTTPLFNFSCAHASEHAGGIMVTASHNPAAYNGFKLTLEDGLPIGKGSGMERICELVQTGEPVHAERVGQVTSADMLSVYLEKVFSYVKTDTIKPFRLVVDGGNGMAQVTIAEVLKRLPVEVTYLYMDPDGTFPNHEANPLKTETLQDLQQAVREHKADVGVALDGDADRVGFVDEHGDVVDASYVGALVGLEVLKLHQSGLMLYDLRSSQTIPDSWTKAGATVEMCMVGHAPIKNMMKQTGAIFASELSLHLYFKDMYGVEAPDLALLLLLQAMTQKQATLSELVAPLKTYHHSGEINFEVEQKDQALLQIETLFTPTATRVSHLDGLWMKFDWGFLSVRKSNTEPVLRLNVEAVDEQTMRSVVEQVSLIVRT